MSGEESSVGVSESISPTRKDESGKGDMHAAGEELFRRIAVRVWLDGEAVSDVIESSSMETWRKRRSGLHVFCGYLEEKKKDLNEVFKTRPDVILSNILTQIEKKGDEGALDEMRKLKSYKGVALSLFSDMRNVAQSSMVLAIVK
ncbi:MAG: hypothetical protein EZS28_020685 [Streblomastix strix]|uniref:Uncharacterized protein n=1 Tax=Streblomastix strix TaxID=222440 RepID=A0A5J4VMH0_9EUKA|nr:MAG: hypothetical protein EZS28_020685 [Streblomastix strix]